MSRAILPVLLKTGGPQAPMKWTAMGCSMLVLFRTSQLAPTPSISTTPATPPIQIMVSIFFLRHITSFLTYFSIGAICYIGSPLITTVSARARKT
jgi:hypothetical protein